MTHNFIVKATAEFINANEKYLSLALVVEEAVPVVRKTLIKKTLECVESNLKRELNGTGDTPEQWHVQVRNAQDKNEIQLYVCKEHWLQQRMKKNKKGCWGVLLGVPSVTMDWSTWIGVADISEMSDTSKEKIKELVDCCVGPPYQNKTEIYHYLENYLKNWNKEDFLTKAIKDKERNKIAKDLATKLKKLAREVDTMLGEEPPRVAS